MSPSPHYQVPLTGPDGGLPTPRQMANRLLKTFSVLDAYEFFAGWCESHSIPPEAFKPLWDAELASKDVWESREAMPAVAAKPAALTDRELRELDIPEPTWLVKRIIPVGGLVAISGRPGSYKSFFALWLATRIANGLPLFEETEPAFFCNQETRRSAVLFIEEENSTILTRNRVLGLKSSPTDNIHYRIDQGFKMKDETWRQELLKEVEESNIKLIIMDPFSSVMGLENENDNAEVSQVMDIIRKDFIAKGITVLFIHHPSKGDDGGKTLRGAGDILGKCDVHLHLEKDEKDRKQVTVSFEKMRLIADTEVQNFNMRASGDSLLRDMRFQYLGEAKPAYEVEREDMQTQIRLAMLLGVEYTQREVASSVGSNAVNKKFKAAWKAMVGDGEVRQTPLNKKFIRREVNKL